MRNVSCNVANIISRHCNPTRPTEIDDIPPPSSSERVGPAGVCSRAKSDDQCLASMAQRQPCRILVVVAGSNADAVGATLTAFHARDRGNIDALHVLTSVQVATF